MHGISQQALHLSGGGMLQWHETRYSWPVKAHGIHIKTYRQIGVNTHIVVQQHHLVVLTSHL